jgi:16S rRNA (cytidine1402-2'-O)-methyltransferase
VQAAHAAGVQVVPLSGPSSLILAVAASGLNGQSFAFVGYLPTDAAQRTQRIQQLEQVSRKQHQTQLVIETPYRNQALADALLASLQPDTRLAVACGLTLDKGWNRTLTVKQWQQAGLQISSEIPTVFAWLAG